MRTEKNLSLDLTNQIAAASVAACAVNGYAVTATVVDRVAAGASTQLTDRQGLTPLALAQARGYREMVEILQKAGVAR